MVPLHRLRVRTQVLAGDRADLAMARPQLLPETNRSQGVVQPRLHPFQLGHSLLVFALEPPSLLLDPVAMAAAPEQGEARHCTQHRSPPQMAPPLALAPEVNMRSRG